MSTQPIQVRGASSEDQMILTLKPDQLPSLKITQNGATRYKTVTWVQLLRTLDHSITVQQLDGNQHITRIPRIPHHVLQMDVVTENASQETYTLTGAMDSKRYPFVLEDRIYSILFPTLVYQATWHKPSKTLKNLRIAVTVETVEDITMDTPLYRFPFSNVYPDTRVCWNQVPTCELNQVEEKGVFGFLQTRNNSDLFGLGNSQNSPYREYASFLEVVEAEGLHLEWLIPLGKTVTEFHESK